MSDFYLSCCHCLMNLIMCYLFKIILCRCVQKIIFTEVLCFGMYNNITLASCFVPFYHFNEALLSNHFNPVAYLISYLPYQILSSLLYKHLKIGTQCNFDDLVFFPLCFIMHKIEITRVIILNQWKIITKNISICMLKETGLKGY